MGQQARVYIAVKERERFRVVEKAYVPIKGTKDHERMYSHADNTYILAADAQLFDIELRKHHWSLVHEYPVYLFEKGNPAPIKRGGTPSIVIDADELDDMIDKHTVRDLARGMIRQTFDPIQLMAGAGIGAIAMYLIVKLVHG